MVSWRKREVYKFRLLRGLGREESEKEERICTFLNKKSKKRGIEKIKFVTLHSKQSKNIFNTTNNMKKLTKTIALVTIALLLGSNLFAQQGDWAGKVKYTLAWKGNVPQGVPQSFEAKVYKNLEGTDFTTYMMMGGLMQTINNSSNLTTTYMLDFSMFPDEGATEGMSGKWYFKDKMDIEKVKENTKYEYTGNKKEIAGVECEEVKVTFSSEGESRSETIWVTKTLGPKVCMTYYPGLDAFPMEFPIDITKEISVTFTVAELQKGKVSQAELLLESGYEEITKEDFQDWMKRLGTASEEGGAQGAGDDDM